MTHTPQSPQEKGVPEKGSPSLPETLELRPSAEAIRLPGGAVLDGALENGCIPDHVKEIRRETVRRYNAYPSLAASHAGLSKALTELLAWVRPCSECKGEGGDKELGACRFCGGGTMEVFGDWQEAIHIARSALEKARKAMKGGA